MKIIISGLCLTSWALKNISEYLITIRYLCCPAWPRWKKSTTKINKHEIGPALMKSRGPEWAKIQTHHKSFHSSTRRHSMSKNVHDLFYRKSHNSRKSFFLQKFTTLKITPWSNLSHGEKHILQRRISELKLWLTETVNKAI